MRELIKGWLYSIFIENGQWIVWGFMLHIALLVGLAYGLTK